MFPACALLKELQKLGYHTHMITDERGSVFCEDISNKIICDTIRLSRKNFFSTISSAFRVCSKIFREWRKNRPDIVISFGGVFTIIPSLMGKILGSKLVIYEQNAVVGKANRLLFWCANVRLCTLLEDKRWTVVTPPVRREFLEQNRDFTCAGKIKITVIGGSQGAESFSRIVPDSLSMLDVKCQKNIEIVQQVSAASLSELQKRYDEIGIKAKLVTFIDNIAEEMSSSQLIICRAGASTLAELAAIGCPAILIPYPKASDNHQFFNALRFQQEHEAWAVVEDHNAAERVQNVISDAVAHFTLKCN